MNWGKASIGVLDFEGTVRTGVVEFGMVVTRGASIVETDTATCCPEAELLPEDERAHGLREKDLAGATPFRERLGLFSGLRASVDALGAHHAVVEENLLKAVWPYPPTSDDKCRLDWGPWVDTRRLYERLYPHLTDYGLGALVEQFQLGSDLERDARRLCPPERRKLHCALYDALASSLLLTRLLDEPEVADASLAWLLDASAPGHRQRKALSQGDLFAN